MLAIIGTGTASATQAPLPVRSVTPASTVATDGVKAPVSGLLDRHHVPAAGYTTAVRSYVVDTTWAALQPQQGGPLVHPNAIDVAIDYARTHDMTLALRVRAGVDAPAWAKQLGGAPMTFHYTDATVAKSGTVAGTVGRFWTPQFSAAYADLQERLAAAYDNVPEIRQTDITQCSTIFAETYLRDAQDKRNLAALDAAGFTRTADDACHVAQLSAHRVWQHTMSALSMNPYQWIRPGKVGPDMAYTIAQMQLCRTMLGGNCLLANHSLSRDRTTTAGLYPELYAAMFATHLPVTLQTSTKLKVGDLAYVLSWAGQHGVRSIELPTGYVDDPVSMFWPAADRLVANAGTAVSGTVAGTLPGTRAGTTVGGLLPRRR